MAVPGNVESAICRFHWRPVGSNPTFTAIRRIMQLCPPNSQAEESWEPCLLSHFIAATKRFEIPCDLSRVDFQRHLLNRC